MATVTVQHWSVGHHETFYNSLGSRHDWINGSNSANGWSVYLSYSINTDKTSQINYVVFTITPVDSVGGAVYSETSLRSTQNLQDTGPITKSQVRISNWENIWYTPESIRLRFDSAKIIYSDGSTETVSVMVSDNRNHVDFFSHYENEMQRAYFGYKPRPYNENKNEAPGCLAMTVFCIVIIIIVVLFGNH